MSKIITREVKIGVAVLVALVILFFGINFLKGVNIFKAANYYYASFTSVEGLANSAPVTLNGFKVGQVRDIEYDYDNPGHVIVEMGLDRQLHLPVGTKAILNVDMLGTATIMLQLGTDPNKYAVGDKIIGENRPGLVEALSGDLLPSVSTIFPKIDTLLTNINALVANPALQASVSRLDAITADLQNTTKQLSLMAQGLAPMPGKLNPILDDVQHITANVSTISDNLNQLSGKISEVPIEALVSNLQATTDNLKQLTEQLNDPNSTIGMMTHNAELYDNLNSAAASLDSLLIDVKKNPKRYISIKVF